MRVVDVRSPLGGGNQGSQPRLEDVAEACDVPRRSMADCAADVHLKRNTQSVLLVLSAFLNERLYRSGDIKYYHAAGMHPTPTSHPPSARISVLDGARSASSVASLANASRLPVFLAVIGVSSSSSTFPVRKP